MHLLISGLFAVTVVMAFLEDYLKEIHKIVILAVLATLMVLLATTKSIDHTADGTIYEHIFYNNDEILTQLTTEPTFLWLSRLVLALGGGLIWMFLIYALIAIPTKLKALYGMTPYIFTALIIYIPIYYELHDLIQIRAAAACAFLLLALNPLSNKRYWTATLLMIIAILFHYSSVVFIPFLFIGNRQLGYNSRLVVACVIPVCFVIYLMGKDLFSLIPSSILGGKLDYYQKTSEKGEWEMALLYKNVYFMLKVAMMYLCLYFYNHIVENNRLAPLLLNLFLASILSPMLFSTIPVIASRVSDMYGIIDCIVFTFALYLFSTRYLARFGILIIGIYMLIYHMMSDDYFF
jgi:hypothetical protein